MVGVKLAQMDAYFGQESACKRLDDKFRRASLKSKKSNDTMDIVFENKGPGHPCVLSVVFSTRISEGIVYRGIFFNEDSTTPWQALIDDVSKNTSTSMVHMMFWDLYRLAEKRTNSTRKTPLTKDDWDREGLAIMTCKTSDSFFESQIWRISDVINK